MATPLQRLSTDYVEIEDRIRMAGQTPAGPIVMWLTGRLASRAIPAFLRWLDEAALPAVATPAAATPAPAPSPAAKRALQGFAQEVAVAKLKQQPPVAPVSSAPAWLVTAIDLQAGKTHLDMVFRGMADQSVSLRFNAVELRQWMAILHRAWSAANWPPLVWPDWIRSDPPAPKDLVRH
jgi:hypothetical protein